MNEGFEGKPQPFWCATQAGPDFSNVGRWSVFCDAPPDAFNVIIVNIYAPISEPTTIVLLNQGKN